MNFVEPIKNMKSRHTNNTPHGRSLSYSGDKPGHNVFKGWVEWKSNGHQGIGEAVDLLGSGGTEVFAIGDAEQIKFRRPEPKLEHVFLEGDGFIAVYAHINAVHKTSHVSFNKGDVVGTLLASIGHLHFELWLDGYAVTGATPAQIRDNMLSRLGLLAKVPGGPRLIVAKPSDNPNDLDGLDYLSVPSHWNREDKRIEVDTEALSHWIGTSNNGLAPFVPVREAFEKMGFKVGTDVEFDSKHIGSIDPRVYAFLSK